MTSKSTTNNSGLKTLIAVAILGAVCFIASKFIIQITIIDGPSMEPSYKDGQWVVVNRLDKNISSGDVIVFEKDGIDNYIVKRVWAIPGDIVEIKDGHLTRNGKQVSDIDFQYPGIAADEITLGENEFFVLGDNTNNSKDSRYEEVGTVKAEEIIGTVIGG